MNADGVLSLAEPGKKGPLVADRPRAPDPEERIRLRAGLLSLVVGALLLVVKYVAYVLTDSAAILSDALESIINVVAASFALASLMFAGKPADTDHPYGHGKIEYFSAVFEGGLIAFAAIAIIWYAIADLLAGPSVKDIEFGAALTLGAGFVNALLGWYLIRTGQRVHSMTLEADGRHVLSDFWTSLGAVVGLGAVRVTGLVWLDPVVALVLGANLARTGVSLVRRAAGGLLDKEDTELLAKMVEAFDETRTPGVIRIHGLRAIRAGRFTHVDAHLVLPEYWTIDRAHDAIDAFERRVVNAVRLDAEIEFHSDPCRQALCSICDVFECPIRREPFEARPPMTIEEARLKDDAFWALRKKARAA